MADHTNPALNGITTSQQTSVELETGSENLQAPEYPSSVDILRREYQNFELEPNLKLSGPVVELALAAIQQSQIPNTTGMYYVPSPKNYEPNFENKLLQYQQAVSALGKIYNDRDPAAVLSIFETLNPRDIKIMVELNKEYYNRDLLRDVRSIVRPGAAEAEKLEIILNDETRKVAPPVLNNLRESFPELLKQAEKELLPLVQYLRELAPAEYSKALVNLKSLDKDLPPEVKEIVQAFLEGNRPLAEALILNKEIRENTLTLYKVQQAFEPLNPEDKAKLTEIYLKKFETNLYSDIKEAVPAHTIEQNIIKEIITGKLDDSAKIYILSQEAIRDKSQVATLIKTLSEQNQNDVSRIKQDIQRTYQVNLDSQFAESLSGKEQFSARLSLYGKPDTLEDEYLKRRAIYEFERLKKPELPEKILDNLAKKGRLTDQEIEAIEKQHRKISELKENLTEKDELHYYNLLNFFDKNIESYEVLKKRYYFLIKNLISSIAAALTAMMANEFQSSTAVTLILSTLIFFIAHMIAQDYFRKTEATEKALENFRDRRSKRKKSHKSRKPKG